ncbi:hypothetical protein LPB142_08755 [Rhodobacter xanthinilyticus]|uniref:DNA-binding response regulator n=1 Tax=Rhodobacter xanthinilyticus TaxID=1850250 RepID=A0A1D9MC63_9RHOB|nr:LytTR family DNA-binding domain-containing protein [Rhodobacter xanthinilyticus]AOZ69390.1 hypothetical protein LPB142_08755 [Rhodobacter xanthinilyticus]
MSGPLRVLIVDDEPIAARRMQRLLRAEPGVEVVGVAQDGAAALVAVRAQAPEVILLDIEMPGGDGFALLDRLGPEAPVCIFVTAFDHHALRAFEREAVDYLTKPVAPARLAEALGRARARRAARESGEEIAELRAALATLRRALAPAAAAPPAAPMLWVTRRGQQIRLAPETLDHLTAERDYTRLHQGDQSYLMTESLGALAERLAPLGFLRVHRSVVVRLGAIARIESGRHGALRVVLSSGAALPVGRSHAARLRAWQEGERGARP